MPLGLIWWQQLGVIACAVIPIGAFWAVVVLNALYPWWWSLTIYYYNHAVFAIRYGKINARIMHGLCPRCAYNLRGNTTGICSECGKGINFIPPRILPSQRRVRRAYYFPGLPPTRPGN